ncbi:hypothetical protein ABT373_39370 [Streptomyces sp. NPDC000070]|uniref:hypothetical protein n=1 Tax=Streptomyces sp. NPDC000070 TaxID=3154240 RepID=UPI00332F6A35
MLSYLAAALPENTPAAARLLALQCALRVDAAMQVRLPRGMLRSLRLDTPDPWRELEHARWLRIGPASAASAVGAELLDAALLSQAPARPDRAQAADWALRVASPSTAGVAAGPLLQLASLYLAAHTDPDTGTGLTGLDQLARACGIQPADLPNTLDQLIVTGLLISWQTCRDWEDLHWALMPLQGKVQYRTGCSPGHSTGPGAVNFFRTPLR